MKRIRLENGFECSLDENVMNNMELVDALAEGDDDNPIVISKVCRLIYGDKVRNKLYDHIREQDGRVPIEKIAEAVKETFEQFGDKGKK